MNHSDDLDKIADDTLFSVNKGVFEDGNHQDCEYE